MRSQFNRYISEFSVVIITAAGKYVRNVGLPTHTCTRTHTHTHCPLRNAQSNYFILPTAADTKRDGLKGSFLHVFYISRLSHIYANANGVRFGIGCFFSLLFYMNF